MSTSNANPSFMARLSLALRLLGDATAARKALEALSPESGQPALSKPVAPPSPAATVPTPAPAPVPAPAAALPPERQHASGLLVLGLLQREGRLIDFLQEDVAAFSDAEIGAAARVVHDGCRKALGQYVTFEAAHPGADGDPVALAPGYDTQRIQITGNVGGQPPFKGTLRHHGWYASEVKLPSLSKAVDPRVIAPAEVEL